MIKLPIVSPTFGRHYALFDENDFVALQGYKFWLSKNKESLYLMLYDKESQRDYRVHKWLMGRSPRGKHVDHINGNTLDNRRENLRFVTTLQNSRNQIKKGHASVYKGVCKHRDKWRARITYRGKKVHLGAYKTQKEAALAYNEAALKYHKEYATLNDVRRRKVIRYQEYMGIKDNK